MIKQGSEEFLKAYKEGALQTLDAIREEDVAALIELLRNARDNDRQIFLLGNGGSASTASHCANDLGKGASCGRAKRFRAHPLTDNIAWMTALANDLDYSQIFVEQLKNFARPGDTLIAFSGSGNSANVIEAVEWGRQNSLHTVGVTGRPGGRLGEIVDQAIFVETSHMGHIEEGHFLIQHMLAYYFMSEG